MKDLAPDITRQRLLIEGHYTIGIDRTAVASFLLDLASHLSLRTYGPPMVHSPEGTGTAGNQGFDAFVPLIDSGISLYVWSSSRFFAVVLFTCKTFDTNRAIGYTREYFGADEVAWQAF